MARPADARAPARRIDGAAKGVPFALQAGAPDRNPADGGRPRAAGAAKRSRRNEPRSIASSIRPGTSGPAPAAAATVQPRPSQRSRTAGWRQSDAARATVAIAAKATPAWAQTRSPSGEASSQAPSVARPASATTATPARPPTKRSALLLTAPRGPPKTSPPSSRATTSPPTFTSSGRTRRKCPCISGCSSTRLAPRFWWITRPTTGERKRPLWTYADDVQMAARRLAARYHDLRTLPVEALMLGGAPLLGDVLLENFDVAQV